MKKTILKITVSTLLFAIILSNIDRQSLVENIKMLDSSYVPLVVGFLITNYLISSVRWKKLIIHEEGENVSVFYLIKLYFVGSFFNNFMPTSIGGDVYKIFRLGKKLKSTAHAFSATFMERFTGVIALVLISYFGMFKAFEVFVSLLPQELTGSDSVLFVVKLLLLVGFWIAALVGYVGLKIVSTKISKIKKIYDALIEYRGKNKVLLWAFVTSFAVQFLAVFTQYFIFKALGFDLPVVYSLFVFPVITLASFFIPSLNGIGVQDALYIRFFAVVGVSNELALSASILYHLFRLFVSLIGGVVYAFSKED